MCVLAYRQGRFQNFHLKETGGGVGGRILVGRGHHGICLKVVFISRNA